jgi:hypothetical protein
MNSFKIFLLVTVSCMVASSSFADIYEWTDEDGIKHYSNYAPSENSRILMKTKEAPHDEEADRVRAAAERQAQLELARLEIAQRQAELELREAEAEQRLTEAERLAEEALRDAKSTIEETEDSRSTFQSYGYKCYDYYFGCSEPIYGRRFYRNKTASIFFKKPPYATPYRHHSYKRGYGDHYRNDYRNKYRLNMSYRPTADLTTTYLNARGRKIPGGSRTGPLSGGTHGRTGISGRSSGIGRRR